MVTGRNGALLHRHGKPIDNERVIILLEFVLFFLGMPLAITLLYNYCDRQKKREARLKRIEQERISEAKIAQIAEHQRELKRQHEQLVHDQIELAKQQAREEMERKREDERLAKEQEKQAVILEKHEKRIELLEYKVRKLGRDIEAQNELLADYYAQLDWLLLQQSGTVSGGSEFAKWQNKIVTKNNQIRKAECKLADMNDAKERAEKEMEVA